MNNARESHSAIKINDDILVVVGGTNTNTCEMLNLKTNDWTEFNSLKSKRSCGTLMYHKEYIYLFMGLETNDKELIPCSSIERIRFTASNNYGNGSDGWEIVSFTFLPGLSIPYLCLSSIVPIDENKFYLVGGRINENTNTNLTFKVDLEEMVITYDGKQLPRKLVFYESNFVDLGEKGYGLYSDEDLSILIKLLI